MQVLWEVLAENLVHSEVETRGDGLSLCGEEASSSAGSQTSPGCLWKGDGAHWLALQQLGRLAMLANTLPSAGKIHDLFLSSIQNFECDLSSVCCCDMDK